MGESLKYLKYKNKYIDFKNQIGSGQTFDFTKYPLKDDIQDIYHSDYLKILFIKNNDKSVNRCIIKDGPIEIRPGVWRTISINKNTLITYKPITTKVYDLTNSPLADDLDDIFYSTNTKMLLIKRKTRGDKITKLIDDPVEYELDNGTWISFDGRDHTFIIKRPINTLQDYRSVSNISGSYYNKIDKSLVIIRRDPPEWITFRNIKQPPKQLPPPTNDIWILRSELGKYILVKGPLDNIVPAVRDCMPAVRDCMPKYINGDE